jgi:DNA-binding MarR family transcriptional regulator
MLERDIDALLDHYPKIFFACHSRHVRDPASRRVLSAHQASILSHLDEVEPTNLMDLAKHMGVTASTMSLAVERLVRHGYLLRSRDPRDGRRVNLTLSAAGVRVRDAQSVLDRHRVKAMLGRLSPAERNQATRGLATLARAAREQMHELSRTGRRGSRSPHGSDRETPHQESPTTPYEAGAQPRRKSR